MKKKVTKQKKISAEKYEETKKTYKSRKPKDVVVVGEAEHLKDISSGLGDLPALTPHAALTEAKAKVSRVFEVLSEVLQRPELPSGELAHMRDTFQFWSNGMKEMDGLAKERQRERVLKEGSVVTSKGSMELVEDGWRFQLRPQKTGYDDRKVEAMLRAKGLPPEFAMHKPDVPYETDVARLEALASRGEMKFDPEIPGKNPYPVTITQADLDACKYELTYAVLQPERVEGSK
jgi:hypothetical protein